MLTRDGGHRPGAQQLAARRRVDVINIPNSHTRTRERLDEAPHSPGLAPPGARSSRPPHGDRAVAGRTRGGPAQLGAAGGVAACAPLLLHGEQLWASATRNTLGLTGMALLVAVAAGATRSWMLPFPYVLAALLLGTQRSSASGGSGTAWWAFVLQDASDLRGVLAAAALLAAGIAGYLRFGVPPA